MSGERFRLNMMRNPSRIFDNGKVISKYNTVVLLNKLYEENQELKEENKQLRKELNGCEKFRYTVFKLMNELNDE